MMTIRSETPPSLQRIQELFGLQESDLDIEFGVLEVDPQEHLFTFMVEEEKAKQISENESWIVGGPFSNPKIEPFGPPQ